MKRMVLLLAAVFTLAAFTACEAPKPDSMQVSASQFSEETKQVLQVVQDELAFFDYSIDNTVKSCSIDFWVLENGEWVNAGKVGGAMEAGQHRIAIRMTDGVCELFQLDGFTKSSYPVSSGISACGSTGGARLETETAIEPDKEIVLWTLFGSNQDSMSLGNDDFRSTECDAGMAATLVFFK